MTKEQAIEKVNKIITTKFNNDYSIDNVDKEAIEIILSMLEEQDKIIDLMANHIATSDSDLCEYLDITTKCKYYAGENKKLCDDCIKQYFENKAKELLNK